MKPLPKEEHKQRIVFLIPPEQLNELGMKNVQEISKAAIKKEFRKQLKNK